jgi:hypothetical protein
VTEGESKRSFWASMLGIPPDLSLCLSVCLSLPLSFRSLYSNSLCLNSFFNAFIRISSASQRAARASQQIFIKTKHTQTHTKHNTAQKRHPSAGAFRSDPIRFPFSCSLSLSLSLSLDRSRNYMSLHFVDNAALRSGSRSQRGLEKL